MKSIFENRAMVGIALLILPIAYAHAKPYLRDEVTLQNVAQPLDTSTLDAYLLDMARSANINVVADATNFPADVAAKPYPSMPGAIAGLKGDNKARWGPTLLNVMSDFEGMERLSLLRTDDRTFLFWRAPQLNQFFQIQKELIKATEAARFEEAVAAAQAAGVPETELFTADLSRDQLQKKLLAFLKERFNWTASVAERNDKVDLRVALDDLPPDLRALVLLDVRRHSATYEGIEWLDKSFWKTADIHIHISKESMFVGRDNPGDTIQLQYKRLIRKGETEKDDVIGTTTLNWMSTSDLVVPPASDEQIRSASLTPQVSLQLGPLDTFTNVYSGLSDEAPAPTLDDNAKLQTPISLEAKHVSLRELLTQLEQQSGAHFTLAPDAPADKLVTARVDNMPLAKFMGLLTRVYGVKWKGEGGAYTMRGNDQGELHLTLLQMGDIDRYRLRFIKYTQEEIDRENASIAKAILDQVGEEALRAPDGVSLASLPEPVVTRLQRAIERNYEDRLAVFFYRANQPVAEELSKNSLVLRFSPFSLENVISPNVDRTRLEPLNGRPEGLRLRLQSQDGHVAWLIFDIYDPQPFNVPLAEPGEEDSRPRSRRR